MPLIGNLIDLRAYAAARGQIIPADDTLLSQALQRASDYIGYEYVPRFRLVYTEWPAVVVDAVYEAAILEARTPNFFNRTYTPGERKVLVAAGDIRWQVVGSSGSVKTFAPVSTRIEQMLRPLIEGSTGTNTSFLLRA